VLHGEPHRLAKILFNAHFSRHGILEIRAMLVHPEIDVLRSDGAVAMFSQEIEKKLVRWRRAAIAGRLALKSGILPAALPETQAVPRPTESSRRVDGSGVATPSTGVLKVSEKEGSFKLLASIPMQY
jgi:hypothetical protein